MPDEARLKSARSLAELVARHDGAAPKYTSYPTAQHFTAAVGEATYRAWLSALPAGEGVALHAHIPLCTRLCWYCGCNTRVVHRSETIGDYVHLLLDEARLLAEALPRGAAVRALHLGGGTPNVLDVRQLGSLLAGLKDSFAFAPGCEIAAELDPGVLTVEWVRAASEHGLRRASLGVQTLDPAVQAAVNRRESLDDIARCVGWLRDAGVRSINLNLMYGLPFETTHSMLATVDAVIKLRPERIAVVGYSHVPWMKPHQRLLPEAALPGPVERVDQSEAAAERLATEGYVRIGMDQYALPEDDLAVAAATGRLRRTLDGYSPDVAATVLGLGASSISALPQGLVQNAAQEVAWRNTVRSGHLPVVRGAELTDDDRLRAEIIERLMCDLKVDLDAACARHGRDPAELEGAIQALRPFADDGLLDLDGRAIVVREPGRLVIRSIAACFDAYAPPAGAHSQLY